MKIALMVLGSLFTMGSLSFASGGGKLKAVCVQVSAQVSGQLDSSGQCIAIPAGATGLLAQPNCVVSPAVTQCGVPRGARP